MFKRTTLPTAVLGMLAGPLLMAPAPMMAAPIAFADAPPGTGFKPPKPNVIISLDNSGSMAYDINGCKTLEWFQAGYDGGPNGVNYVYQNDTLYIRANNTYRQTNCLYETTSGAYKTYINNNSSWTGINTYAFGGRQYHKAQPGASRISVLKSSLSSAIQNPVAVPDGSIRLAWQSMWNNGETVNATALTRGATNSMKIFEGDHKTAFLNYLSSLKPDNGTPSHRLMKQAFDYMSNSALNVNSPWAKAPGSTAEPYLSCRRAYHIFLTDGAWNGQSNSVLPTGNLDHSSITGVGGSSESYDPNAGYARVFKGTESGTLADWAFKSWATDLQTGIANDVEPLPAYREAKDANPSTTEGGITVPIFWNPRYNPATWQHLVTHTIGYGTGAYSWPDAPLFDQSWVTSPAPALADTYGGDFTKLYQGTATWPTLDVGGDDEKNRQSDLWHMALNSRGQFYPVENGDRLTAAFTRIFKQISDDNQPGTTSTATSGSSNIYSDLGIFTAAFESQNRWKGYVQSETLGTDGNTLPNASWGTVEGTSPALPATTADKLDKLTAAEINDRVVLTYNDMTQAGVTFAWKDAAGNSPLSAAQQAYFTESGAVTDEVAENRVNFIRGDRDNEDGITYRLRQSRQGDIVNSVIWYTGKPASNFSYAGYRDFAKTKAGRTPIIYVGGNDGMLHGFSAVNGSEKIAYVPKGVMAALPALTKPSYGHQFFVDGSPFAGDVDVGSCATNNWKTMLVGTLGAGGRGYFVLDVTDPSNFSVDNAADLVEIDATLAPRVTGVTDADGTDLDLGHVFSAPVPHEFYPMRASQIARMNNGRWAAVLGNGYNSANEKPVLYIQYLSGADKSVVKLQAIKAGSVGDTAANKTANGLSAPRLVDINGDDSPDVIYAGDLKGNLWKFDVSSSQPADWDVAFNGAPLFTAYARANNGAVTTVRQPITAAPTVRPNANGRGMMVAFGTGRNVTVEDRSSIEQQSLYSVLDNTHYRKRSGSSLIEVHPGETCSGGGAGCLKAPVPAPVASSAVLVNQSVSASAMSGEGASAGTQFWSGSKNTVDWTNNDTRGWYLNLPATGERVLSATGFYDGSNVMAVLSRVPASGSGDLLDEMCSADPNAGKQFLTLVNIMNGWPPSVPLMDKNGDNYYSTADGGVSRMSLLTDSVIFTRFGDSTVVTSAGTDSKNHIVQQKRKLALMPVQAIRPSWRQLQ